MKTIVLFGPPGSGKGTMSNKIKEFFDCKVISTGELLREASIENTKLGRQIKQLIDAGSFVSDDTVNDVMKSKLKQLEGQNVILDGYPRNISQAELLNNIRTPDKIIFLHIEFDIAKNRIVERGKTSNRKDNQNVDIIEKRFLTYSSETAPLAIYYSNKNMTIINADRPIEQVFEDIKKELL